MTTEPDNKTIPFPDRKEEQKQTIQAMSALVNRALLASQLGMQYGGDRDIYQALGYDTQIPFEKYAAQYERQDIARAIINRPVNATWQGGVTIMESDEAEDTALEKDWKTLVEDHELISKFVRIDKLSGIGSYGILLLGLDDVQNQQAMANPIAPGERKLLYVKPLGEGSAVIKQWDRQTRSERFGMPTQYGIVIRGVNDNTTQEILVHYNRVIHIVSELLESEIEGTPRLQPVFNRLKDLEKIVGGSAEMFWRGARPGYYGKLEKEFNLTPAEEEELETQIDEYEHNLRRILTGKGIDMNTLAMQVADPSSHVDVQLQMISAITGIPKRILTGTERGELASTQDTEAWLSLIEARRDDFATPRIVRPFVDRCIEFGILSEPKDDYSEKWQDLWALSDKDKADIGKIRADALKAWGGSVTAQDVIPAEIVPELLLGVSEEQAELIENAREAALKDEVRDLEGAEENVPDNPNTGSEEDE